MALKKKKKYGYFSGPLRFQVDQLVIKGALYSPFPSYKALGFQHTLKGKKSQISLTFVAQKRFCLFSLALNQILTFCGISCTLFYIYPYLIRLVFTFPRPLRIIRLN